MVQAIFFGMMLSWTPSIVLLAWLLWREKVGLDLVGQDLSTESTATAALPRVPTSPHFAAPNLPIPARDLAFTELGLREPGTGKIDSKFCNREYAAPLREETIMAGSFSKSNFDLLSDLLEQ
jgi:hypothetical protein